MFSPLSIASKGNLIRSPLALYADGYLTFDGVASPPPQVFDSYGHHRRKRLYITKDPQREQEEYLAKVHREIIDEITKPASKVAPADPDFFSTRKIPDAFVGKEIYSDAAPTSSKIAIPSNQDFDFFVAQSKNKMYEDEEMIAIGLLM